MIYSLLREILFCFPPEEVHYFSMDLLRAGCSLSPVRSLIESGFCYKGKDLQKTVFGLDFSNPVGLGAGFDKNARYLNELAALGFGFVEIGTVTPKGQPGNEKPRLFRLPADKALINRMGFNNDGVDMVKKRLADWNDAKPNTKNALIVGGNIGKNKLTPNEDAWKDYRICFDGLFEEVAYFVVNVSSPNTPGLRELQEKDSLKKILSVLQDRNQGRSKPKPLLLKIAPDLTREQLDDIVSLSLEIKLDGLVATNTTISREALGEKSKVKSQKIGAGGLSGMPVRERATEVVRYLSEQTHHALPIIASGGIFTGKDAEEKLTAGASLVQVWTGFIYEGPSIVKNICRYLSQKA